MTSDLQHRIGWTTLVSGDIHDHHQIDVGELQALLTV